MTDRWIAASRAAIATVTIAGAGALGAFAVLGEADAGSPSTNPCLDDGDVGHDGDNDGDSGIAERGDQPDGQTVGGDDCVPGDVDVGGLPDDGTDDGTQDTGQVDDGTVDGVTVGTDTGGQVGAGAVEPVQMQPTFTG